MITVQLGMDVGRQARKFDTRIAVAPIDQAVYLAYLKGLMLATVAMGAPRPFSEFYPLFEEEFGL